MVLEAFWGSLGLILEALGAPWGSHGGTLGAPELQKSLTTFDPGAFLSLLEFSRVHSVGVRGFQNRADSHVSSWTPTGGQTRGLRSSPSWKGEVEARRVKPYSWSVRLLTDCKPSFGTGPLQPSSNKRRFLAV